MCLSTLMRYDEPSGFVCGVHPLAKYGGLGAIIGSGELVDGRSTGAEGPGNALWQGDRRIQPPGDGHVFGGHAAKNPTLNYAICRMDDCVIVQCLSLVAVVLGGCCGYDFRGFAVVRKLLIGAS